MECNYRGVITSGEVNIPRRRRTAAAITVCERKTNNPCNHGGRIGCVAENDGPDQRLDGNGSGSIVQTDDQRCGTGYRTAVGSNLCAFIRDIDTRNGDLSGTGTATRYIQTVVRRTARGDGNRQRAAVEISRVRISDRGRVIHRHGAAAFFVLQRCAVECNHRFLVGHDLVKRQRLGCYFSRENVQVIDGHRLVAGLAVHHRVLPGYQAVELEVALVIGVLFSGEAVRAAELHQYTGQAIARVGVGHRAPQPRVADGDAVAGQVGCVTLGEAGHPAIRGGQVVGLAVCILCAVDLEQVVRGGLVRAAEGNGELGCRGELHVGGDRKFVGLAVYTGKREVTYVYVLGLCRPGHQVLTGDHQGAGAVIVGGGSDPGR